MKDDFIAASDAQICHDNFLLAGDEILRQHREAFHLRVPEQEFVKRWGHFFQRIKAGQEKQQTFKGFGT